MTTWQNTTWLTAASTKSTVLHSRLLTFLSSVVHAEKKKKCDNFNSFASREIERLRQLEIGCATHLIRVDIHFISFLTPRCDDSSSAPRFAVDRWPCACCAGRRKENKWYDKEMKKMVNNGTLVESDKWELWKKVKGAPFCLIKSVFNVKTFKFHLRTTRRAFCSRVNKFTLLAQGKFYFSHFSRLRSHSLGTLFFFFFSSRFVGAQSLLAEVQFHHHHRIYSHDLSWTVPAFRATQQRNFIMNFFPLDLQSWRDV